MSKTYFVTGGTGLIGSYLIHTLLKEGHTVFALARTSYNKDANDRLRSAVEFWKNKQNDYNFRNLTIITGDVRAKQLSINKSDLKFLARNIESIYHCAALTKFTADWLSLKETNIVGTDNLLQLACRWKQTGPLKKVNYLSTAFVYGDYRLNFSEIDLDVGQSFSTQYQKSKFLAERKVYQYRSKGLWVDIFRPPAVSGESWSGKINTFEQSICQSLRTLALELCDAIPVAPKINVHIVPVDELSKALYVLDKYSLTKNLTFHPFHPAGFNWRRFITVASDFLKLKKVRFITRNEFYANASFAQKTLIQHNIDFIGNSSLNSKTTFKLLNKYNFAIKSFDQNMLLNLLSYMVKTNYLKIK